MEPISVIIITAVSTFVVVSGLKLFCHIRDRNRNKSYIHPNPFNIDNTYNVL
jgi:hypothetical protein